MHIAEAAPFHKCNTFSRYGAESQVRDRRMKNSLSFLSFKNIRVRKGPETWGLRNTAIPAHITCKFTPEQCTTVFPCCC